MTSSLRACAIGVALILVPSPRSAQADEPKSGPVIIENDTGEPVWVLGEFYIDAAGKRVEAGGVLHFDAGEKVRILDGRNPLTAREYVFSLISREGVSPGW